MSRFVTEITYTIEHSMYTNNTWTVCNIYNSVTERKCNI